MRKRSGGLRPNSGLTSSVGNGDIKFVTPLFQVVHGIHFIFGMVTIFRTIGISHIPRQPQCHVNKSFVLSPIEIIFGIKFP